MDMIDKKIYDLDYIRELQARYKTDPGLLERVLYAFGLLEALVKVRMKFTFKGGTKPDAPVGSSDQAIHGHRHYCRSGD